MTKLYSCYVNTRHEFHIFRINVVQNNNTYYLGSYWVRFRAYCVLYFEALLRHAHFSIYFAFIFGDFSIFQLFHYLMNPLCRFNNNSIIYNFSNIPNSYLKPEIRRFSFFTTNLKTIIATRACYIVLYRIIALIIMSTIVDYIIFCESFCPFIFASKLSYGVLHFVPSRIYTWPIYVQSSDFISIDHLFLSTVFSPSALLQLFYVFVV